LKFFAERHENILTKIRTEKQISKELSEEIKKAIAAFKETFNA